MKKTVSKKAMAIVLSLVMVLSVFSVMPLSAFALDASGDIGDNVTWSFDSDTGTLTISGTGDMWNYTSTKSPFYHNGDIKTVSIGDGITSVGNYVFQNCDNMEKVSLPDSIRTIGLCAFLNCFNLTTINLPEGLTTIGDSAFQSCAYKLSEIAIPSTVTTIGDGAFSDCQELTSISIPSGVKTIESSTFENCSALTAVYLDKNTTTVERRAFYWCNNLTNVYYTGSETDRGNMSISTEKNDSFINAKWHYNFSTILPGSGTSEDPYLISNYTQLKEFSRIVNNGFTGACGKLENNIICKNDLNDEDYATDWTPIGSSSKPYTGVFDGQGYVIRGLSTPDDCSMDYVGLFGYVGSGGIVQNVGLEDGKINGKISVGGVVGITESGTVTNCYNTGCVSATEEGAVIGGVIGRTLACTVTNCYNTGFVSATGDDSKAGGVIGANSYGTVTNCYNTASVSATGYGSKGGGVIGYIYSGTIESCYNTGSVSDASYTGGVTGASEQGIIKNCFNTGVIIGTSETGGIVGENQKTVTDCYNIGSVSGGWAVGGVSGRNFAKGVTENSFYDKSVCGDIGAVQGADDDTNKAIGLSTAEMTGGNALDNMAFTDTSIWLTKANADGCLFYPHLKGFAYDTEPTIANWPAKIEFSVTWVGSDTFTYNGSNQHPTVSEVTFGGKTLGTDEYSVSYQKKLGNSYSSVTDTVNAGEYKAVVTITSNSFTFEKKFTISKAKLTITAKDKEYTYNGNIQGEGDTVYTTGLDSKIEVSGLVGSDNVTQITLFSQATNAGEYENAIVPSNAQVGNSTDNYDITYVKGKLTIKKVAITITAASEEWTYDGNSHSNNTVTVTSGQLQGADTLSATASGSVRNVADTSNGNNPVASGYKVMNGNEDRTENYNITTVAGKLTIKRKGVTVKADDINIKYGDNEPELTATVTGLVGNDKVDYTLSREKGSNFGNYTITPSGEENQGNYKVTYQTGILGIGRADAPTPSSSEKPTANTLVENGKDQELVSAPSTLPDGYTRVEYKLGDGDWSTDIPTASDVGDYNVHVRYIGDNNHQSFLGDSISVRIKALYTVTWLDDDGSEFAKKTFAEDEAEPTITDTPEKDADAQYTYKFDKWVKDDSSTVSNIIYNATYTNTVNKYKIDFVDEDGTVLQSEEVEYGETPVFKGEEPTKEKTDEFTYAFGGWDNAIEAVTGEATYTATYTETRNEYTIKFVDEDGTVLQQSDIPYGETPEYTGEEPTKASDGKYTYEFDGWDEEIDKVTGDKTYTATFKATEIPEYLSKSGTKLTWTKGSGKSLVITIKRSYDDKDCFAHFVKVLIDGKEVEVDAKAGSTVITLDADTLEELSVGDHTVTVVFDDGASEMQLEVCKADAPAVPAEKVEIPKTGNEFDIRLLLWLMMISLFGFMSIDLFYTKKRGTREEQE